MSKTIRIRVSDTLYDKLKEKAVDNEVSLSDLSRNLLEESIKDINDDLNVIEVDCSQVDPLHNSQFILLLIWMYYQREPFYYRDNTISLELIKFFKSTLDFHIEKLNPMMREMFIKVKNDFDRIVKYSKGTSGIITRFGSRTDQNYFDYDLFENYLMKRSM